MGPEAFAPMKRCKIILGKKNIRPCYYSTTKCLSSPVISLYQTGKLTSPDHGVEKINCLFYSNDSIEICITDLILRKKKHTITSPLYVFGLKLSETSHLSHQLAYPAPFTQPHNNILILFSVLKMCFSKILKWSEPMKALLFCRRL